MRRSIMLAIVSMAIVIFLTISLPLGVMAVNKIRYLEKELAYSQEFAKEAERRIVQLLREIKKLSENSKTDNLETLNPDNA